MAVIVRVAEEASATATARAKNSARQARDWATVAPAMRCQRCKHPSAAGRPTRHSASQSRLFQTQLFPVYGEVPAAGRGWGSRALIKHGRASMTRPITAVKDQLVKRPWWPGLAPQAAVA